MQSGKSNLSHLESSVGDFHKIAVLYLENTQPKEKDTPLLSLEELIKAYANSNRDSRPFQYKEDVFARMEPEDKALCEAIWKDQYTIFENHFKDNPIEFPLKPKELLKDKLTFFKEKSNEIIAPFIRALEEKIAVKDEEIIKALDHLHNALFFHLQTKFSANPELSDAMRTFLKLLLAYVNEKNIFAGFLTFSNVGMLTQTKHFLQYREVNAEQTDWHFLAGVKKNLKIFKPEELYRVYEIVSDYFPKKAELIENLREKLAEKYSSFIEGMGVGEDYQDHLFALITFKDPHHILSDLKKLATLKLCAYAAITHSKSNSEIFKFNPADIDRLKDFILKIFTKCKNICSKEQLLLNLKENFYKNDSALNGLIALYELAHRKIPFKEKKTELKDEIAIALCNKVYRKYFLMHTNQTHHKYFAFLLKLKNTSENKALIKAQQAILKKWSDCALNYTPISKTHADDEQVHYTKQLLKGVPAIDDALAQLSAGLTPEIRNLKLRNLLRSYDNKERKPWFHHFNLLRGKRIIEVYPQERSNLKEKEEDTSPHKNEEGKEKEIPKEEDTPLSPRMNPRHMLKRAGTAPMLPPLAEPKKPKDSGLKSPRENKKVEDLPPETPRRKEGKSPRKDSPSTENSKERKSSFIGNINLFKRKNRRSDSLDVKELEKMFNSGETTSLLPSQENSSLTILNETPKNPASPRKK